MMSCMGAVMTSGVLLQMQEHVMAVIRVT